MSEERGRGELLSFSRADYGSILGFKNPDRFGGRVPTMQRAPEKSAAATGAGRALESVDMWEAHWGLRATSARLALGGTPCFRGSAGTL